MRRRLVPVALLSAARGVPRQAMALATAADALVRIGWRAGLQVLVTSLARPAAGPGRGRRRLPRRAGDEPSRVMADFARLHRVPAVSGWSEVAEAGKLLTDGPSRRATGQRAAGVVDRILRGARPGDLPV